MTISESGETTSRSGISSPMARLAGFLYLGTIASGLFAEVAVRARVRSEDAATTALNIARGEVWYRLGEAADLFMLCCYIAVTALLYRMFAPSARSLALVAAGFSFIGIAVLAVAGVLHLMPLAVLEQDSLAHPEKFAQLALALHGDLYGISLVFFGAYCFLIGLLSLRSQLLPLPIGILMMAGGLTHVVIKFLWIIAPAARDFLPSILAMLPLLGEAALAIWLLSFGVRRDGVDAKTTSERRAG